METRTLADLTAAHNRTNQLAASLDRGMVVVGQLEAAERAKNNGVLPNPIPPGEYLDKYTAWHNLLLRYQKAVEHERTIKNLLKAQSKQKAGAA